MEQWNNGIMKKRTQYSSIPSFHSSSLWREVKMTKRCFLLMGLAGIFLISVSCVGPSRLAMDYGTSYKLAKYNQILNPEAEKNLEPVTGFDGGSAQATVGKYRKGFEEKVSAPTYVFGIGGMGGTAK